MKEKYYVSFNAGEENLIKIFQLFKKYNKEKLLIGNYPLRMSFRQFYISADDPFLKILDKIFEENHWELNKRLERNYSDKELSSCKLLTMRINRVEKGRFEAKLGNKFDLSKSCEICRAGMNISSNLFLNESDIPKKNDISQTYDHQVLISRRIKDSLEKENILGVGFIPIFSSRIKKNLNWFKIHPKKILPPFSGSSKGITIENQCTKCHRTGFYGYPTYPIELHYDKLNESILKNADIFYTYEFFGYSEIRKPIEDSIISNPLHIFKPKILNIFNDLKIKGLFFEPVIVNGFPDLSKWKESKWLFKNQKILIFYYSQPFY